LKLLLISSVIPQETTATELVLFRHFAATKDEIEVAIASDHPVILQTLKGIPIYPNAWIKRLTQTRFAPLAHGLRHWPMTFNDHSLQTYLKSHRPDAILTVAHGELYQLAMQTAQRLNTPLVTFFHDWLPDTAWVFPKFRPILTQRFHKLYHQSQIAFCVSKEMQQRLGKHANAVILPPIPDSQSFFVDSLSMHRENYFTLAYAGNLSDCYKPLIQQLGNTTQSFPRLKLQLFGQCSDWPEHEVQQFKNWGIYQGFLSRNTLFQKLLQSDALLVVMSFELHHRTRMETSFPSKIVEYCQFGRPIIIWGPEYCSAVGWARQHGAAAVVTTPDPNVLLQAVEQLSKRKDQQQELAECAKKLSKDLFNPEQIQRQFLDALKTVIKT